MYQVYQFLILKRKGVVIVIEIKNINIKFDKKECIRNGNFQAYPSQITGIYGESGTGKSSLLYVIGMLSDQPHDYYFNHEKLELSEKEKASFRNEHIAFITQNSMLIETMSVEKNIEFYLVQAQTSYSVDDFLEMIHLTGKKKAFPKQLSGGERQRVALACALAMDAEIILGDEVTAALDKENKDIVMSLLRECAKQGKTVILVSHENNIIEQCDRVYRLEHLELTLEKANDLVQFMDTSREKKKVSLLKMFQLLFYSSRKYNIRRLAMSFLIMILLFMGTGLYLTNVGFLDGETYSSEGITPTKVLVMSDEQEFFRTEKIKFALHAPLFFQPISQDVIQSIDDISEISNVYDYYIFNDLMIVDQLDEWGNHENAWSSLKATRNGQQVKPHDSLDDVTTITTKNTEPFSIIPFYQEDTGLKRDQGVYINTNMEYSYNLQEGDELEITMNVPIAMLRSTQESESIFTNKNKYYDVKMIGTQVVYHTKVLGIIEANSLDYQIFMQDDIMRELMDEQMQRYKNGEIKYNLEEFEADGKKLEELKPYAKALYIDKEENVLKVVNKINEISDKDYAYNEYQSVLELKESGDQVIKETLTISGLTVGLFTLGAIIINVFYLLKYKSVYMMMNLIGFFNKTKVYLLQMMWQIMNICCFGAIVYITTYIPRIITGNDAMKMMDMIEKLPSFIRFYMSYGKFSMEHFTMVAILLIIVMGISYGGVIWYYHKKDLVYWIRGKS